MQCKTTIVALMVSILILPFFVQASESLEMLQVGISGSLTIEDIILRDINYDGKDSLIVGTSTGLYIFTEDGELDTFLQTASSVTNVAFLDDATGDGVEEIVISTTDTYFPNVQCYDIMKEEKLWEFSPKTEVYDTYILWTMLQTAVFDIDSIEDLNYDNKKDLVLSSGYSIFALDGTNGNLIWTFEDSDNIWNLEVVDDYNGDDVLDILAGDQNGYLYLVSGLSGVSIWEKLISENYEIINPQTNSVSGTVKTSVWDVLEIEVDGEKRALVSAEDGSVYLINIENGEIIWEREIIDYVDTLMYQYYGDSPQPTGIMSYNFFNLRVITTEDHDSLIVAAFPGTRGAGKDYKGAVKGLYLLNPKTGEVIWDNENVELAMIGRPQIIELDETYVAVPLGKSGSVEKIKLLDMDNGLSHETVNVNSTLSNARVSQYIIKSMMENKFLLASDHGDLVYVEYPGSSIWSYPRINDVLVENMDLTGDKTPDILVRSREGSDSENTFNKGNIRTMFVIDGETKDIVWSYEVPYDLFSQSGGLQGTLIYPDIDGDGKSDIVSFTQFMGDWNRGDMYGENSRIIAISGKTGRIIKNISVHDKDYYGSYDVYYKNDLLLQEMILEGVVEQSGMDMYDYEMLPRKNKIEIRDRADEIHEGILERKNDFRFSKRIQSMDIFSDYNNDGFDDLIIGSWNDVFILDLVNEEIIWNRTRRTEMYRGIFDNEGDNSLLLNWTQHDRCKYFVVGDTNGDGIDDLAMLDNDGFSFLHSQKVGNDLNYTVSVRYAPSAHISQESVAMIEDMNNNGVDDIVFEEHMQDAPSKLKFVDGRNGFVIMEADRSGSDIQFSAADFDGNGFEDSIIFQMWTDAGGPILLVKDGRSKDTIWSTNEIDEAWMITDLYRISSVNPATPVGDVNGDGITDMALAKSQAWQKGAEVVIYELKSGDEIKTIVVEESDINSYDEDRWIPGISTKQLTDINGDGVNELGAIMIVGESHRKEIKMYIIDVENSEVISDFSSAGTKLFSLGTEGIGMVGASGNIYFLDTSKNLDITKPASNEVTTSPITVTWTGQDDSTSLVFVDNKRTLITDEKEATFEILSGEHKVTVYSFDRYGKGVYDHVKVNVVKDNTIVSVVGLLSMLMLIVLFFPKLYGTVMRVKS